MNTDFFSNWNNQARKGLLELAILNDIHNRKMYAYEIEKKFCKSQGLTFGIGSIYNILRRFKQQRTVTTWVTKSGYETLTQMNASWHAIKKALDTIEKGI